MKNTLPNEWWIRVEDQSEVSIYKEFFINHGIGTMLSFKNGYIYGKSKTGYSAGTCYGKYLTFEEFCNCININNTTKPITNNDNYKYLLPIIKEINKAYV